MVSMRVDPKKPFLYYSIQGLPDTGWWFINGFKRVEPGSASSETLHLMDGPGDVRISKDGLPLGDVGDKLSFVAVEVVASVPPGYKKDVTFTLRLEEDKPFQGGASLKQWKVATTVTLRSATDQNQNLVRRETVELKAKAPSGGPGNANA